MLPGQTHQENISPILSKPSTPFYVARQTRHFMKHAKHGILRSTLGKSFFEPSQTLHFMKHAKHANFLKRAKHDISWSTPSTQAHKARNQAKRVSTPIT